MPLKRNDRLLETLPAGLIVFPGTGIQDNLADKAAKMGIPLWDFRMQSNAGEAIPVPGMVRPPIDPWIAAEEARQRALQEREAAQGSRLFLGAGGAPQGILRLTGQAERVQRSLRPKNRQ